MHRTERLEDMSPDGKLRIICQMDGDFIVAVCQSSLNQCGPSIASVEFCTTASGGGRSPRTHAALKNLMIAMAQDNELCDNGRPEDLDAQAEIAAWVLARPRPYPEGANAASGRGRVVLSIAYHWYCHDCGASNFVQVVPSGVDNASKPPTVECRGCGCEFDAG